MTTTSKTLLGALVLILVLGGAFYAYGASKHKAASNEDTLLPTPASDTSDDALESDAAAIDAELSGLDEDTAILEESLDASAATETP